MNKYLYKVVIKWLIKVKHSRLWDNNNKTSDLSQIPILDSK
jgi:hypothetical protein